MNHYSLMKIANHTIADRRAEADRARLARSASADAVSGKRNSRTLRKHRPRFTLGTVRQRVSLF